MAKSMECTKTDEKTPSWKEMTWREKFRYFWDNITVEPVLACYIMPSVFASLATQNLNLEKACRVNLGYSTQVCDALSNRETANYTLEEAAVQRVVAEMGVWKSSLLSAFPAIIILFGGAWSDRWGRRKPCIVIPILGEFFTVIGLIACTYFFYELPMEVNGFIEGVFPALTGGWFVMFMGVFSYVGDVTTVETRTLRIGIVNIFCSLGFPVGLALSGILYRKIGFYGVFSVSATCYLFAFFYGCMKIKEAKRENLPEMPKGKCGFIRDFFNVRHLADTYRLAFKAAENNRRMKILLIMFAVMVITGPLFGEMVVSYLFTRFQFNWDEVDYSIYSTYSMVTNLIGTGISVGIFSHIFKIDDAIVGIYSSMSKILASFVYGFAKTATVFYLGAIVEILNGTSFIAMRSIASKLVPTEELGKINSLFGVCEALAPLIYGPMYSATYAATLNIMPGAFFLLGGALTVPAVVIFAWLYMQHRREAMEKKLKEEQANLDNNSILKDVTLVTAIKETQICSPVINGFSGGVDNAAFEAEKATA